MTEKIYLILALLIAIVYISLRKKTLQDLPFLPYARVAILLLVLGVLGYQLYIQFSWFRLVVLLMAAVVAVYISKNYILNNNQSDSDDKTSNS